MRKRNISFIADKLLWFILLVLPLVLALVFTCKLNGSDLSTYDDSSSNVVFTESTEVTRSLSSTRDTPVYYVGSYYDSTSTDYFYFNASGFVNTQDSIVYLPIQASITTYSNGSQFSTFTYNSNDNRYEDYNEYIFLSSATGVDSISVNSVELFPFTFSSWDSFDTMIEEHLFTYTYLDTIQWCFKMSFDCEFYAYIYSYTDGDDYPIDSDEPDEPIPEPSPSDDNNSSIFTTYFTNLNFCLDSWFTFGSNDIIYNSFNSVFGSQSQILPIFIEGSFIPKYLTYMGWIYVLHVVFDLLVFIPRLAHKWMGGVYNDDE